MTQQKLRTQSSRSIGSKVRESKPREPIETRVDRDIGKIDRDWTREIVDQVSFAHIVERLVTRFPTAGRSRKRRMVDDSSGIRSHISCNPKPRVVLKLRGRNEQHRPTRQQAGVKNCGNRRSPHSTAKWQYNHPAPSMAVKRCLISINMLAEDRYRTTLNESTWMISRGNLRIGSGHKYNNLYPLMAIQSRWGREHSRKDWPKIMARPIVEYECIIAVFTLSLYSLSLGYFCK